MNINNKTFYAIIVKGTLVCLILGMIIRASIKEFKFENNGDAYNSYSYCPYNPVKYSNGTYPDIDEIKNKDSLYKYIVKGKCTGDRKVLEGAVLTEIQVNDVLKGNISKGKIKLYEPVDLQENIVCTFEGYNFIENNKEYIFCLTDLKKGVDNYDGNNIKIYNYATPFYGKFPVEYKESDYKVYVEDTSKEQKKYNEFQNCEQVFPSEERKKMYLQERSRLMKLLYDSNINLVNP